MESIIKLNQVTNERIQSQISKYCQEQDTIINTFDTFLYQNQLNLSNEQVQSMINQIDSYLEQLQISIFQISNLAQNYERLPVITPILEQKDDNYNKNKIIFENQLSQIRNKYNSMNGLQYQQLQQQIQKLHQQIVGVTFSSILSKNLQINDVLDFICDGHNILDQFQENNNEQMETFLQFLIDQQKSCNLLRLNTTFVQFLSERQKILLEQLVQFSQFKQMLLILCKDIKITGIQDFNSLLFEFTQTLISYQDQQQLYQNWKQNKVPQIILQNQLINQRQLLLDQSNNQESILKTYLQIYQIDNQLTIIQELGINFEHFDNSFSELTVHIDTVYQLITQTIQEQGKSINMMLIQKYTQNPENLMDRLVNFLQIEHELQYLHKYQGYNNDLPITEAQTLIFDKLAYESFILQQFQQGNELQTQFLFDNRKVNLTIKKNLILLNDLVKIELKLQNFILKSATCNNNNNNNNNQVTETETAVDQYCQKQQPVNINKVSKLLNNQIVNYNLLTIEINQMRYEDIQSQKYRLLRIQKEIWLYINNKQTNLNSFLENHRLALDNYKKYNNNIIIDKLNLLLQSVQQGSQQCLYDSYDKIRPIIQLYVSNFNQLKNNMYFYQNNELDYQLLNQIAQLKTINIHQSDNTIESVKDDIDLVCNHLKQDLTLSNITQIQKTIQPMNKTQKSSRIPKLQTYKTDISFLFQPQNFIRIQHNYQTKVQLQVLPDLSRIAVLIQNKQPQQIRFTLIRKISLKDNYLILNVNGIEAKFTGQAIEKWYQGLLQIKNK